MSNSKTFIAFLMTVFVIGTHSLKGQNDDIVLSFTANHNCTFAELDSILIENRTQGGSTVLYYPDTVFSFLATDIQDIAGWSDQLLVSQNYPNPFSKSTKIDVYVPKADQITIQVYDLAGRKLNSLSSFLTEGLHQFKFFAGNEKAYVLSVYSQKHAQQRLMLQKSGVRSSFSEIVYYGESSIDFKNEPNASILNDFMPGDELKFTGFITDSYGNIHYKEIIDTPLEDQFYLFDIDNNVPAQPSAIDGPVSVSVYETGLVYEVNNIPGHAYLWTLPDGWVIESGQGSHSITVTAGVDDGTISVRAENGCGVGPGRDLNVVVDGTVYALSITVNPDLTGSVSGEGQYVEGQDVDIEGIPNQGWMFVNWTGDTNYLDDPDAAGTTVTMPAYDISLTANFTEDEDDVFVCGSEITFAYNGQQVTYGTIERGGLCWMDRNLGAEPMPFVPEKDATHNGDTRLFGDIYQWGRLRDGHQDRQSNTTSTLSDSDVPGHSDYIATDTAPYDWRSPQNSNLWQGEDGVNNPCPPGWRVPTAGELDQERISWSANSPSGAFDSPLKWPVAGYRNSMGVVLNEGSWGMVWSSSASDAGAGHLYYYFTFAQIINLNRAFGAPVRCVRDH